MEATFCINEHSPCVTAAAWSPDDFLAVGQKDGLIIIYYPFLTYTRKIRGHPDCPVSGNDVNSVAWSRDGRLASGSDDKSVKIWDPTTGDCLRTLTGHAESVLIVAWARDGRLASGSVNS